MTRILDVSELSFSYPGSERPALDGVSFSVEPSETVGLIGANGAGKSTLLLQLVGVLAGTGTIHVEGTPVKRPHLKTIRNIVGMVLSDPDDQIFMPTVYDDIAFGPRNQGRTEDEVSKLVTWALERVGLKGFENRPPHFLSRGEKRRTAIASVIALKPRMLILDEPSAELDPRGRRELMELLDGFGEAKIIASHDLDFIANSCSRCLVMCRGALVADGAAQEILGDQELLGRYDLR